MNKSPYSQAIFIRMAHSKALTFTRVASCSLRTERTMLATAKGASWQCWGMGIPWIGRGRFCRGKSWESNSWMQHSASLTWRYLFLFIPLLHTIYCLIEGCELFVPEPPCSAEFQGIWNWRMLISTVQGRTFHGSWPCSPNNNRRNLM